MHCIFVFCRQWTIACVFLFVVCTFSLFWRRKPTHRIHPADNCYISCLSSAGLLIVCCCYKCVCEGGKMKERPFESFLVCKARFVHEQIMISRDYMFLLLFKTTNFACVLKKYSHLLVCSPHVLYICIGLLHLWNWNWAVFTKVLKMTWEFALPLMQADLYTSLSDLCSTFI